MSTPRLARAWPTCQNLPFVRHKGPRGTWLRSLCPIRWTTMLKLSHGFPGRLRKPDFGRRSSEHTKSDLMDFMHIFEHNRHSVVPRGGEEILIVKGFFGRAANFRFTATNCPIWNDLCKGYFCHTTSCLFQL